MVENRNEIQEIWPGWKIESEIGSGGFGKVYKARKELLGQKETYSAIKVIRIPNDPAELSDMQASRMDEKSIREYYKASVEQLTNEIELMERMKSASHVVAIEDYDVVEESETIGWTIYIRMELLTNLNTFIQKKGMSTQDVIKMGIDVLTGLEFCHQEKLIHRDIKPDNIFVSDFGEYKIGDFGISREIESTSVTLSQKGTKNYMAPEIVRMEPYGHLVDIYALGLTLYEILNNGRMPFLPPYPEQYTPMDRERAIVKRLSGKEELPEIRGIGRLNDIIRKACAHEPKDRYQSAAEMRDDLQAFSEKFYGESDGKTGVIGSEDLKELQEMLRKLEEEKKKDVPEKNPGSEPQPESEPQPGPEPKPSTEPKLGPGPEPEPESEPESAPEPLQSICPRCGGTSYLFFSQGYYCPSCGEIFLEKNTAKTTEMKRMFQESKRSTFKERLSLYEKLLQKDENSAQLHLRIGLSYIDVSEYERARIQLERALDLDSRDGAIYHFLGTCYLHAGQYEQALEMQSKAHIHWRKGECSVSTVNRLMYRNYALIYEEKGNSEMAFRYALRACRNGCDAEELITTNKIGNAYAKEQILKILKKYDGQLSLGNRGNAFEIKDKELRSFCSIGEERRVYLHVQPSILSITSTMKRRLGAQEGVVLTEDRIYCISSKKPIGVYYLNYAYLAEDSHQIVTQGGNLIITKMLHNEDGQLTDCVMHTGKDAKVIKSILEEIQNLYRLE